jgi:hypothetical protein
MIFDILFQATAEATLGVAARRSRFLRRLLVGSALILLAVIVAATCGVFG